MTTRSITTRLLIDVKVMEEDLKRIRADIPPGMLPTYINLALACQHMRELCEARIAGSEHERARRSAGTAGAVTTQEPQGE